MRCRSVPCLGVRRCGSTFQFSIRLLSLGNFFDFGLRTGCLITQGEISVCELKDIGSKYIENCALVCVCILESLCNRPTIRVRGFFGPDSLVKLTRELLARFA